MQYDVFISCEHEDYKYAEEIYEFLEANGIHTFLASKSLRIIGASDWSTAIHTAFKSSYHLVIFASNAEYVDSTWVYYGRDMFIADKLRGRRSGEIVTILKDVNVDDINMDLWKYESFTFDNYKEHLLSYVESPSSLERKNSVCGCINPSVPFDDKEDSILEDNDDDSGVCYCIDPSSSFEDMKDLILVDNDDDSE